MVKAVCKFEGTATGVIKFDQADQNTPIHITGELKNLTPGKHGFHVHEFGDLSSGCTSAGSHYNPDSTHHGGPHDPPEKRHNGDLGNIVADSSGVAKVDIKDTVMTLFGPRSVIGRSMVVHAKEDDLGKADNEESKKTGNSGDRVGCGIIGLAK